MFVYSYSKSGQQRFCISPDYNWRFDMITGKFERWGKNITEDPIVAPSPEILDIEISTFCTHGCPSCYKSNSGLGENMSLKTFKELFGKFTKNLTQIAFGIGDIDANPDMIDIFKYCRENAVIPNVTISGSRLTDFYVNQLASLCGAVSVSHYDDNECFNAVERLSDRGLKQANIHQLVANETINHCIDTIKSVREDKRLNRLNALVFLLFKPKGRGLKSGLTVLKDINKYKKIISESIESGIKVGMDSCSAPMVLRISQELGISLPSVEPCESMFFSMYINVKGEAFPCSFVEGEPGWETGISVLSCKDFADIWSHIKSQGWRKISYEKRCHQNCQHKNGCRVCPVFNITPCAD